MGQKLIAPYLHLQGSRELYREEGKESLCAVLQLKLKSVDSKDWNYSRVFGTNTFGKVLITSHVLKA